MGRNKGSRSPKIHNLYEKDCTNRTSAANDICNYDNITRQQQLLAKFQKEQQEREKHLVEIVVKTGLSILVPIGCDVRKRIAKFLNNVAEQKLKY